MPGFFCDSSAIVKRYVNETGSNFVDSLADLKSGNVILLARITRVEVAAAMAQTAATAVLQLAIVYSQIIVSGDEFFEAAICDLASAFTGKVDMGRVCDDGRVVDQCGGDGVVVNRLGRSRNDRRGRL